MNKVRFNRVILGSVVSWVIGAISFWLLLPLVFPNINALTEGGFGGKVIYVSIFFGLSGIPTCIGFWLTKMADSPFQTTSYLNGVLSFITVLVLVPLEVIRESDTTVVFLIFSSILILSQIFYWYLFERMADYFAVGTRTQKIVSGDNSTNVQVGRDYHNK